MAWVRFILIFILLIQLTVLYSLIVEALQISDNQHNCPKCGEEIAHGSCEKDTHRMRWNFAMREYKIRSK